MLETTHTGKLRQSVEMNCKV